MVSYIEQRHSGERMGVVKDVPASAGADVVVAAVSLTFISPFLADVEWEGLRV